MKKSSATFHFDFLRNFPTQKVQPVYYIFGPESFLKDKILSAEEKTQALDRFLSCSFIGSVEDITPEIGDFIHKTGIDELMVTSHIYNQDARIKSYALLKSI